MDVLFLDSKCGSIRHLDSVCIGVESWVVFPVISFLVFGLLIVLTILVSAHIDLTVFYKCSHICNASFIACYISRLSIIFGFKWFDFCLYLSIVNSVFCSKVWFELFSKSGILEISPLLKINVGRGEFWTRCSYLLRWRIYLVLIWMLMMLLTRLSSYIMLVMNMSENKGR